MKRPLYVLVDTNVAIQQAYFFRKKGGIELIEVLKATGARLLVPEVLQNEYIKHFGEMAVTTCSAAHQELDKLETLWGHSLTWLLAKEDVWQPQAMAVLDQLKDILFPIPQTDALLVAASHRSMNNRAPCSKTDHGYKDCLIWESVLSVVAGADVRIVSRDKAFYEDEKCNRLAPNILAEAKEKDIILKAYSGKDAQGKDSGKSPLMSLVEDVLAENEGLELKSQRFQPSDHPLNRTATAAVPPVSTTQVEPMGEVPPASTEGMSGLRALLATPNERFWDFETKALGFIAFLDGMQKEALFDLLGQAGMEQRIAIHVCDRLALAGLVNDTGNHYLPVSGRLSELAIELVQPEVISLLRRQKA